MKARRQATILEILQDEAVTSQALLRRRLKARGFGATQPTISRDLKELGLVKRAADGAYQAAGEEATNAVSARTALRRAVGEYLRRVDCVQQLLVLRTGPGQAQPLALAIDRANLAGIVGTIAGDDTILAISRDPRRAAAVARRLEALAR